MTDKKDHGVDAVNLEYLRYDQVKQPHKSHLAEGTEGEFDDDFVIRTCDLGQFLNGDEADKDQFAHDLGSAMQEIGFAILVGHGVDPALHQAATPKVIECFTRPTLVDKLRYRAERHRSVSQGYFPIKETSAIHPDLVEGWVFCRRAFDIGPRETTFQAEAFWPLPELEPFFRTIVLEHEKLILPIMQTILRYLGCDPNLYDETLTDTNFGLRLNYYPPDDDATGAGRLLGHEDADLFTILPAPEVEGLQVLNRENGKWIRLTAPPGSIILSTGDYMQRITNDIIPSTTHRVSKPQGSEFSGRARVSIPMAVYLWEHELLEVLPGLPSPKYEPIRASTFHTRTTSNFYGDDYAVEST